MLYPGQYPGQYPPSIEPLIKRRRNFAQLEDFNAKGKEKANRILPFFILQMKINHERRSLFLAECLERFRHWSPEKMWELRINEQRIHESHGEESQLYFTHVKALLMYMLQQPTKPYVGHALFHHRHNNPKDTIEVALNQAVEEASSNTIHAEEEAAHDLYECLPKSVAPSFRRLDGHGGGQQELAPEGTQCRACGSTNILTVSVQLRSADESETVFCQCKDCALKGKKVRWRLN